MRRLYLVSLLAMACTTGDGDASTEGSTAGEQTGSAGTASTGGTTVPGGTDTMVADGSGTGSGDATAGPTSDGDPTGTTSSGPQVPGDCRSLLEQDPTTPDGVHTLNIGGDPSAPTFDAYCDMTTEGGGWTLVGRSAEGDWGEVSFGWQQATGDLADDASPYSLDALTTQLEFSEILLGSYSTGKDWGPDVYLVDAPEHFVFVYGRVPHAVNATTVAGSCTPEDGPHHIRHIGWTELSYIFNVAQYSSGDQGDGLEPGGWDTDDSNCDGGGNLNGTQGMMMVR